MSRQTRTRALAYDLGEIVEIDAYPMKKVGKGRRAAWRPTTPAQEKVNRRRKMREVSRLVNLNFDRSSWMIVLDYDDGMYPDSMEQAKRDIQNFIRRLRPIYKKAGAVLGYTYATERGCETGRTHHHLIIKGGVAKEVILAAWKKSKRCFAEHLEFTENGYADLAVYTAKKQERWERSYTTSKNLIRPEPIPDEDAEARRINRAFTRSTCEDLYAHNLTRTQLLDLFPGYKVVDGWTCTYNPYDRGYYIHMRLIRADAHLAGWATTRGGHPGDLYPWNSLRPEERNADTDDFDEYFSAAARASADEHERR